MRNIKKYFIPVWRVAVLTVSVSLFITSLYSISPQTESTVLGRGLVPASLLTSIKDIEVTQTSQPQELTYK